MKARSINGNSTAAINDSIQQLLRDGFTPTLAIVFISVKQDRQPIIDLLTANHIDCIGATSCSEFVDGHQSEGDIALLLLDIDKAHYRILFEDIGSRSIPEVAATLAQSALQQFSNPSLIICSTSLTDTGAMLDGETLTRSIEKEIGSQINMFGGMAGDDMSFTGTYVFSNQRSTTYGVAVLVLNEDSIAMNGVALSGWKSIGVTRTITKSHNNLLYEIDGKPALEMYLRFLGEDFDATQDHTKFFDGVALHYPLQIERSGREAMMCNPMGYDKEENALVMESNIEQGASFRFSTPPDFDIVETVLDSARQIRMQHNEGADAVLIFSCASRLSALGPMAQQENDGLAAIWNAPMAGFFTYGEFGRAVNGKHEFHSTTCSWVALKEK